MLITAKLIFFMLYYLKKKKKNSPKSFVEGQDWVWNHTEMKILEWQGKRYEDQGAEPH